MNLSKYKFLALAILPASLILASPVLGDAVCNDGWYSHSSGSGTCSWHGGVAYWVDDIPTWEPLYIPPHGKSTIPRDPIDDIFSPTTLPPWLADRLNDTTLPTWEPLYIPPQSTANSPDVTEYLKTLGIEPKEEKTNAQPWWVWAPYFSPLAFAFGFGIKKWRQK